MRLFTVILLLGIFIGCSNNSTEPVTKYVVIDPVLDSAISWTIHRVVDGDTFEILLGRDTMSIRILGIDTYETRHGARLDSQAAKSGISVDSAYHLGQMAKAFADSLVTGKQVLLTRDYSQPNFDSYNRLLRRVYYYEGLVPRSYGDLVLSKGLALPD